MSKTKDDTMTFYDSDEEDPLLLLLEYSTAEQLQSEVDLFADMFDSYVFVPCDPAQTPSVCSLDQSAVCNYETWSALMNSGRMEEDMLTVCFNTAAAYVN